MKNKELKYRFDFDELRTAWAFQYSCLWCGKSRFDSFHHIISPSSPRFKKGDFNSSILNACPIHNEGCHLYNSLLHKEENEKMLLGKVAEFLIKEGYELKSKDIDFLDTYCKLYN